MRVTARREDSTFDGGDVPATATVAGSARMRPGINCLIPSQRRPLPMAAGTSG